MLIDVSYIDLSKFEVVKLPHIASREILHDRLIEGSDTFACVGGIAVFRLYTIDGTIITDELACYRKKDN